MNNESRSNKRFWSVLSACALLATAFAATMMLTACESSPPVTGSSSVEDAGLATRVNARLESTPPTTWGVFATTDGSVLLTAPVSKADMGTTKEEIDAYARKVLKRIFAELPEVRSVHMMDNNREDVGTFKRR